MGAAMGRPYIIANVFPGGKSYLYASKNMC